MPRSGLERERSAARTRTRMRNSSPGRTGLCQRNSSRPGLAMLAGDEPAGDEPPRLPEPGMTPARDIHRLIEIMAALRTPGTGCPWDLTQDFASIAPYTIEEAYEVADAIGRGDLHDLKDELGDLLLQVVFHARMAEEQGAFEFGDVVEAITRKLLRRHPHVFGEARGLSPAAVEDLWHAPSERTGALSGVPSALPALTRALKLQQKAGRVGFDWNDPAAVLDKI